MGQNCLNISDKDFQRCIKTWDLPYHLTQSYIYKLPQPRATQINPAVVNLKPVTKVTRKCSDSGEGYLR